MGAIKTVLLADDSTTTARQLRNVIEDLPGYEVVAHARNGAEAVRLYGELKPDIVCMDVVMPVLDGLQAARSIIQTDKDARIVVISSTAGSQDLTMEAVRLGAKSVISKPFDLEDIRRTLDAL